jgi:predicted aspartyl protease
MANEVGLAVYGRRRVRSVEGSSEIDVANASVTLGGERVLHEIYVSDTVPKVLVGLITLELLGFAVDPVNHRIVPVELLML